MEKTLPDEALAKSEKMIDEKLRAEAKRLIESGKVKYIIGYGRGIRGGTPVFVERLEDIDRFIIDPTCMNNLSVYLLDERDKVLAAEETNRARKRSDPIDRRPVALVVKGCDSRSVIELIAEHIIPRDGVYLIGVPCTGMVDISKLEKVLKRKGLGRELPNLSLSSDGDRLVVTIGRTSFALKREELVGDKCRDCEHPTPLLFDFLAGDKVEGSKANYSEIGEIERMPLEKRWEFWKKEFDKCIRCYACRQVCPLCYCEECAVDPTDVAVRPDTTAADKARRPRWVEKSPELGSNLLFHLTRMMHMAGRCTNCGECERVCPMKLPLRRLTRKLEKDAETLFNHETGTSLEGKVMFACPSESDPDCFIR